MEEIVMVMEVTETEVSCNSTPMNTELAIL